MQRKKIMVIGAEARGKIIDGVDRLVDATKLTLGPAGKNFVSGVRGGAVAISNDGVSLAREIEGRDEFEDIGVRAVREAATKTNDAVGDGTTTAMTLTQAILRAIGFTKDALGARPMRVMDQIEKETALAVGHLESIKRNVETREQLVAVAKVAVENQDLAELIGDAQWSVGRDGTVIAEEHNDPKDKVEYVYGVRIDNGFGTSFLANNQQKGALMLENVAILMTNKIFNTAQSVRDLNKIFETLIARGDTALVLMGRAFDDTALGLCLSNINKFFEGKGGFPIYPINSPYEDMDEVMQDLAAATGGKYIRTEERNVETVVLGDIGKAAKVFVKRYEGIITGPKPGEDVRVDKRVAERVEKIEQKLDGTVSPFEKRRLEARKAQLTAGTAVIKIGAETEQERKYKKDKADDAVNAVKAAIQDGVVLGGGLALMRAADMLLHDDPKSVLAGALRAPHEQIVANAGGTLDIPEWVEDPLRVVRTALLKASSIARSLATTEVVVTVQDEQPMWVRQAKVNLADNDED